MAESSIDRVLEFRDESPSDRGEPSVTSLEVVRGLPDRWRFRAVDTQGDRIIDVILTKGNVEELVKFLGEE
jgi:hypothetical protein